MQQTKEEWFAQAIAGMQPWDGKLPEINFQRAVPCGNYTVVITVGGNN